MFLKSTHKACASSALSNPTVLCTSLDLWPPAGTGKLAGEEEVGGGGKQGWEGGETGQGREENGGKEAVRGGWIQWQWPPPPQPPT